MACFIVVTTLWIFSVCLHEFGHAWAAYRGGDHTVREKGYLSLNPIHYAHPVYSILMPVIFMVMGGIGLPGGAVYIERHLLRSRAWDTWVSLAGPAMNLALVVVISACFRWGLLQNDPESFASVCLGFLLMLQISAIVLNLLPIPPLDGFQAIAPWLPPGTRERVMAASNLTIWILFLVIFNIPSINQAFWHLVWYLTALCGVNPYVAYDRGMYEYRFWEHSN